MKLKHSPTGLIGFAEYSLPMRNLGFNDPTFSK